VIVLESTLSSKVKGLGRAMPAIRKATMLAVGQYWHNELLRKHFTIGAKFEYQHSRRSDTTLRAKTKAGANPFIDLVASGESERAMKHNATITATAKHVRIKMSVPAYFTNHSSGTLDMEKEATTISTRDRRKLSDLIDDELTTRIRRAKIHIALEKVSS